MGLALPTDMEISGQQAKLATRIDWRMNFGWDPFRKECGSYTDAANERAAIPGTYSRAEQG
jgi:hypothetical protein